MENGPCIVDLPKKNVIFHSHDSFPEGKMFDIVVTHQRMVVSENWVSLQISSLIEDVRSDDRPCMLEYPIVKPKKTCRRYQWISWSIGISIPDEKLRHSRLQSPAVLA